jgi:TPR repeat protein
VVVAASFNLGYIYESGLLAPVPDFRRAEDHYREAMRQDPSSANMVRARPCIHCIYGDLTASA